MAPGCHIALVPVLRVDFFFLSYVFKQAMAFRIHALEHELAALAYHFFKALGVLWDGECVYCIVALHHFGRKIDKTLPKESRHEN